MCIQAHKPHTARNAHKFNTQHPNTSKYTTNPVPSMQYQHRWNQVKVSNIIKQSIVFNKCWQLVELVFVIIFVWKKFGGGERLLPDLQVVSFEQLATCSHGHHQKLWKCLLLSFKLFLLFNSNYSHSIHSINYT